MAFADLLAYLIVGASALIVVFFFAGYMPEDQWDWVGELNVAKGGVLLAVCYVFGFVVRILRDWAEIPFIDKMGEYRSPCRQVYQVCGLQWFEYCRESRKVFDELSDEYSRLIKEKYPALGSLGDLARDWVEDDFAERNHTDASYISRLGTMETFCSSMSLVFVSLSVGLFIRGFVQGPLFMHVASAAIVMVLAIFCWIEQEQLNLEIRIKKAAQAITSLHIGR